MLSMLPQSISADGWNPIGGLGDLVNGASGAIAYWSDPWGNTFKALRDAAAGMSKDILPALTSATLPDLTAEWFVNAYKISFATAIFVAVALLIPQTLRTARGAQAGRDLIESAGLYFGTFLVGAMFGPAVGIVLINFFHSLTNVFVSFGVTGSIATVIANFQKMIAGADPTGISGGVPIAVFLMLCMIVGLFLVMLILLVQLVTLYFAGVLFPLGLVWIIDPTKRQFGFRIGGLWFGILAAHPLLFLLLGLAYSMMAAQVGAFGTNFGLRSMVTLLVAIIALFIAALSPLLLMKFAPILPMGSGGSSGPGLAAAPIGARNMNDAVRRYGQDGKGRSTTESRGDSASSAEQSGTSTLSQAAAARAKPSTAAPTAGVEATASGGTAAVAAAGGAAEGATVASAGLAAAGAAESATGVGAAIGIPTLIAAAGITATAKGARLVQKVLTPTQNRANSAV
jgi:type IV secretion system protein TrbL